MNHGRLYDVVVIGGGNAGLCAAISAKQNGCGSVIVVESAPKTFRGGNTRHTRNLRCAHDSATRTLTGPYDASEFMDDILKVTGGDTNERLSELLIQDSYEILDWLSELGVRFQPALSGTLGLARTNAFFLGGGKAMLNSLYAAAAAMGVEFAYDCEVTALDIQGEHAVAAIAESENGQLVFRGKTLVAAAGGFQANIDWLKLHWGPAAENFLIRGTPYNRGRILRQLLDLGANSVGDPTQCHAVAIDARAPRFDSGIVSRLDCVPFSIVVNRDGRRFYDEGEDVWPKRYAIWGRLVAAQAGQIAYSIFDSQSQDLFMPSMYEPYRADSIAELALLLELPEANLLATVDNFNSAVVDGQFGPHKLDDCRTSGLNPPKSHWAKRLDSPPFFAYPLGPGITFTYLGTQVDDNARVLFDDSFSARNIFAAGEIMAGNILGRGYPAGTGMTIGSVFGRIAGREAATHA